MKEAYDGIILGTEHNALVLQGYLCRCGLRVLSLDRAATPGGGLITVENPRLTGFRHNTLLALRIRVVSDGQGGPAPS